MFLQILSSTSAAINLLWNQYPVAGYRYSTQGFYNLSDSAYSRMSGYTVKPPTGDTNEQTQFIDYFNLFYSKRGQEQISISQQLEITVRHFSVPVAKVTGTRHAATSKYHLD